MSASETPPVTMLRLVREALGLSQMQLALRVGVSQSLISRIELLKYEPSPEARERFVAVLGHQWRDLAVCAEIAEV